MAPGSDPDDGPPPERDPYGDRRPPYSEDAEQAVLGAMMIDTDAVMRASEIVIPPIELLDRLAPDELRTVLRSVFESVRVGRGSARGRGPMAERVELVFHGEPSSGVAPLENAT